MKPPAADFTLKVASEEWEFEQIHRLNYRTFVEEIPQHAPNPDGRLVDRFHAQNIYIIALHARTLAGMLALRYQRPFSLDAKVPHLDQYLPPGRRPVEVRLLAVRPEFRKTTLFVALFERAVRQCIDDGFDLAVISGTTRQLKLYRHLRFVPFGPLVGSAGALYQPMYLTCEAFAETLERSAALADVFARKPVSPPRPLNLLPGPVLTSPEVDAAFAAPPISHRAPTFLAQLARTRARLCELTGARHVQVLPGSGSLGTAVVAGQLSLTNTAGLVLSNGEFGERLAAEARRAQLRFDWLQLRWGAKFDLEQVRTFAARVPRGGWIWLVHHETSTGILNPLDRLQAIGDEFGLQLCADCISSLGALPVDLRGVHLATGSSGKGLAAYPGLALVFHNSMPRPEPGRLPGYLDLGHWAAHASSPHTHSSNLVNALETALARITPERMQRIREHATWLRNSLRAHGFALLAPDGDACPGVVTIALEEPDAAATLGAELEARGIWLNFRSSHLRSRNWIQISLLGDPPRDALEHLLHALRTAGSRRQVLPERAEALSPA